jgi:hypothetical protein
MTRALAVLLAFAIAPVTLAEQLPPPQRPAGNEPEALAQGPKLVAPHNGALQPPAGPALGAQAVKKNAGQTLDFFVARHQAQEFRKQARIDRMNQFKAARAAEEQKLYQDWHERYIADTPVRVEYYRALAAAQSQPAISYYSTPFFYGVGPPVVLAPVYAAVVSTPIYYRPLGNGTFFSWGW